MDKVNEILNNKDYKTYLEELSELEKERVFCNHTIEHFLDVSRIAYIRVLEEGLKYSKEVIYAIGLLHDIGRVLEYKEEIPHHEGSVIIAKDILKETSFTKEEKDEILKGIEGLKYSKEVIYAIGLLHDIGRVLEYKEEIPHHEGSVIIAKDILKETSFTKEEKNEILKGIENHRKDSVDELSRIIYESDKLSRNCFSCKSEKDCYWSKEKKNFKIKY